MNITTTKSFVTLKKGDPAFTMDNGLVMANRAGILINKDCPKYIANTIEMALVNGWLEPIAVVKERELLLWGLTHDAS